ncbi:MAG: PDZ domain-containing protein [Cytophagaceae bacterium]
MNKLNRENLLYIALAAVGILLLILPLVLFDNGDKTTASGLITRFSFHIISFAAALVAGSLFSSAVTQSAAAGVGVKIGSVAVVAAGAGVLTVTAITNSPKEQISSISLNKAEITVSNDSLNIQKEELADIKNTDLSTESFNEPRSESLPATEEAQKINYKSESQAEIKKISKTSTEKVATSEMVAKPERNQIATDAGKESVNAETEKKEKGNIGIAVNIDPKKKLPFITRVFRNRKAEKAGLKQGQYITAIDGISTEGKTVQQINSMLDGLAGTLVKITLSDGRIIEVERESVHLKAPVHTEMEDAPGRKGDQVEEELLKYGN